MTRTSPLTFSTAARAQLARDEARRHVAEDGVVAREHEVAFERLIRADGAVGVDARLEAVLGAEGAQHGERGRELEEGGGVECEVGVVRGKDTLAVDALDVDAVIGGVFAALRVPAGHVEGGQRRPGGRVHGRVA